eukprot:scaffold219381_cov70-Cyclotella_meneghiniana.AAC.1
MAPRKKRGQSGQNNPVQSVVDPVDDNLTNASKRRRNSTHDDVTEEILDYGMINTESVKADIQMQTPTITEGNHDDVTEKQVDFDMMNVESMKTEIPNQTPVQENIIQPVVSNDEKKYIDNPYQRENFKQQDMNFNDNDGDSNEPRVTEANLEQDCQFCRGFISKGEQIAQSEEGWVHYPRCFDKLEPKDLKSEFHSEFNDPMEDIVFTDDNLKSVNRHIAYG